MKNLPKLDSKMIVAGAGIALVAVAAFAFGTYRGHHPTVAPVAENAKHDEVAPTQHEDKHEEKRDGKRDGKHDEKRSPASEVKPVPESAPEDDDQNGYEEEVDVQIAHPMAKEDHRGTFTKLVDTYADAVQSVNEKVRIIYRAEEDNRRLKLENAYLRVMVESQKFSCRADAAKAKTETVGKKLATAAGSKAARSLSSIRYQFPENLLPEQLHALGVSYFKVKDDEKSAVIFNFLLGLEDDASFRTADTYLMAGVSLYRLENFKSAQDYFEKIEKMPAEDAQTTKAKRQASYWNALVADRLQDPKRAQKIILENLEKNPHTKEALWVNPKGLGDSGTESHESKRAPASGHAAPAADKDRPHEKHEKTSTHH